jgi:hypothetical protein
MNLEFSPSHRNKGYNFCVYFTRLLYNGKVPFDDHVRYCDKDAAIRAVAFYLTCKDIKNVRVEYFGEKK